VWLDHVADRRTILCILDGPPSSGEELLRRVLADFGVLNPQPQSAAAASRPQLMLVLQRFLASLRVLKARAFIVIENAHEADSGMRQEIQRLSTLDPAVLEILLVTPNAPARPAYRARAVTAAAAGMLVAAVASLWFMGLPALHRPGAAPASPVDGSSRVPPRDDPDTRSRAPASDDVRAFRVQIGAFRDPARADAALTRISELKLPATRAVLANGLHVISVGPFVLRPEALSVVEALRQAGFAEAVLADVPSSHKTERTSRDGALLMRAAALAEKHDVLALEGLRRDWIASLDSAPEADSSTLRGIEAYLDAARRAQLQADRRQLLTQSKK
jgi:cell division septation protein DedD